MSLALDLLVDLLDLEAIEVNIFRGKHPEGDRQRTFGGQVAAQALMAAGRTVDEGRVHSLHSYFLRPGDSSAPTLYEVDRIRDGRSFCTRRVVAIQHGQAIYNMQASFHTDEVSFEHQVKMPDVPTPEEVSPTSARVRSEFGFVDDRHSHLHPIEQRYIGDMPWSAQHSRDPRERLWIRADGELPDDPLLHSCIVTYASDMNPFDVMLAPHEVHWDDGSFMGASLDHCMWFHHEVRADEWMLYDMDSPIAHGGRGLARGFLFSRDGELKVSLVQEGLTRTLTSHDNSAQPPTP
jgi:acyl-CoA thioesterase-2